MTQEKIKALCHAAAIEAMLERWGGILQPLFIEDLRGAVDELRSLANSVQDLQMERDAAIERSKMRLDAKQHWLVQAELVAEAARTAAEKRRADQLALQHRMQSEMHAAASARLAKLSMPLLPDALADKCEAWLQAGGASNVVDAFEAGYREAERSLGAEPQDCLLVADMQSKVARIGLDIDAALRGQVNEHSPVGPGRLRAIAERR